MAGQQQPQMEVVVVGVQVKLELMHQMCTGGDGGDGTASTISGPSVTYAGGGGGAGCTN
jgi:hypothetical protein